jgi:NAD dependent epimerase/dehydratase family enzyme
MSWIHRQDWIAIAIKMITDPSMQGAYNATAPNPVTNCEFTRTLAHCLKRPAFIPVPAWLLKILLGEMSGLVLGSQRVLPERLLAQGFSFKYTDLSSALNQALRSL